MSLSKPNNPVFVADVAVPSTSAVSMLDTNENATRVNQLHGIASSNALGAGIPKQVSNVQASVANAQTGATCTVTVLYRVDPTDKNFAGVNIWVKGYQGNGQLVQVSNGATSPTKFVLNNTGEIVSFTVQAYGNGGGAPLTGAPTCSGTLPQSTSGGFGSSTSTSTPPTTITSSDGSLSVTGTTTVNITLVPFGKTNPAWWLSGEGSCYTYQNVNGTWGSGTANQVKCWFIRIPYEITINKLSYRHIVSLAGSHSALGLYNSSGSKIFSWDNFDTNVGAGLKTTTVGPFTLTPGIYIVACGCDTAGTSPATQGGFATIGSSESSQPQNANGTVRFGTAANGLSAGAMPPTLGTISLAAPGTNLPLFCMEP